MIMPEIPMFVLHSLLKIGKHAIVRETLYFDQMLYSSCGMDNLLDDRDKDYPPFVDIYDEETEEVIETEFMKRIETAKQEVAGA